MLQRIGIGKSAMKNAKELTTAPWQRQLMCKASILTKQEMWLQVCL
jgi:hypothetical protein